MPLTRRAALASGLAMPFAARAQGVTEISFLFPVAVGGPITKIIDGYARAFEAENPDIRVRPVYSGSYQDTLLKVQAAAKAGDAPTMAVLLAVDAFSLTDAELIVPLDTVPGADPAWLQKFYPAFLANGQFGGHIWGVPFQRSTIVLYWNKDAFRDAGMDPEHAPANWADHMAAAKALSQKDKRWGVLIPGTGFAYWLFQALATQAGGTLANAAGTQTFWDTPETLAALRYWMALTEQGASPPGVTEWATTPRDFLEGRAAMIWTTTGNLSNIRAQAKFGLGVAMLPEGKRRGSPTGGGNFHLFKSASEAQQRAAIRFLTWVTSAARAAQWGIDTGYVATRPDAWEVPAMRDYVAGFPAAAVARDQLRYAVPELSTHDNQRVTQVLNDALQSALLGRKPPEAALVDAQAGAERLLKIYRG
jgi:sn-glycerol 3-phosphate transport system substrate-binding protein